MSSSSNLSPSTEDVATPPKPPRKSMFATSESDDDVGSSSSSTSSDGGRPYAGLTRKGSYHQSASGNVSRTASLSKQGMTATTTTVGAPMMGTATAINSTAGSVATSAAQSPEPSVARQRRPVVRSYGNGGDTSDDDTNDEATGSSSNNNVGYSSSIALAGPSPSRTPAAFSPIGLASSSSSVRLNPSQSRARALSTATTNTTAGGLGRPRGQTMSFQDRPAGGGATPSRGGGMTMGASSSVATSHHHLKSRNLVEYASKPISAVEQIIFKGNSDFIITGRQSTKMSIRGKQHHVTTLLVKQQGGAHGGPGGMNGTGSSGAYSNASMAMDNGSDRFSNFSQSRYRSDTQYSGGGAPDANEGGDQQPQLVSNTSQLGAIGNMELFSAATSLPVSGNINNNTFTTTSTTTSAAALPKHHIVMGFGDEYEGEVMRVGPDFIPHGNGILQSVTGQHCFVGMFKNKKREGRGKLATPRFVLWGEWKDNRPDTAHSARIDNCLTGERYRGNYRIVTDVARLAAMGAGKIKPTGGGEISKFSQWLHCSSIEYCKFGELVSQNGTRYFGEWYRGQQTGFGVQIFPNGDRYVGLFDKGLYHGNGAYFTYRRPHVCEECVRRQIAVESNDAAMDYAQARSLLERAKKLVNYNKKNPSKSTLSRERTLAEIHAILVHGACPHHHGGGNDGGSGGGYTYAVVGSGGSGSQAGGFPNCGLAEKLSSMATDGTVYDGIWEKGCFKGEGTHVTLPDRTRITADWNGVTKAENGHFFGSTMEEKSRKWQEHFHWEPLLSAAAQERKDKEYESLGKIRQQLRFCSDKSSFDTILASSIVRGSKTIVNAIKMFRRCFYASFGTCGAMHMIGAGGGVGMSGSAAVGGAGGVGATVANTHPTDAARANIGWCRAHRTDYGGCIHLGKGRRITSTDVHNALTDIFSFIASVQRFVEEMLEDDEEYAEAEDEKYFERMERIADLSNEGGFPSPHGSGSNLPNNNTNASGTAADSPFSAAHNLPPGVRMGSMNDRLFGSALNAYGEYEGTAMVHREVFDAVMREVHDILHNLYAQAYASENRAVHVSLQRLAGITLDDLGVNFGRHSTEETLFDPYAEATRALEGITKYKSLSGKLKCLRQWSQAIDVSTRLAQVKLHDEQLAHARSQTTIVTTSTVRDESMSSPNGASVSTGGGDHNGNTTVATITKVKAIESGSADDLLPIHQYVLLNATIPNLLVEVKMLVDATADSHLVDVASQDSFCITTLQACVSSIPQMDLSIRDESAIVTPSAMFAHRAEEALLAAASLPSDLVEYGYLRDAVAVMLGVLPEFPSLTIPMRMEAPQAYPLLTFDYVRSWVPSLLNVLYTQLDGSAVAFEWRRLQVAHKHEEANRKSSGLDKRSSGGVGSVGNAKLAPKHPAPPPLIVPFAVLGAEGDSPIGNTLLTAIFAQFMGEGLAKAAAAFEALHQKRYQRNLIGTINGVTFGLLTMGAAPSGELGVPQLSMGNSAAGGDNQRSGLNLSPPLVPNGDDLGDGSVSRCTSSSSAAAGHGHNNNNNLHSFVSMSERLQQQHLATASSSHYQPPTLEDNIRNAMLRDALLMQRKAGLDDTYHNAAELIRIAKDTASWPLPVTSPKIVGDTTASPTATVTTAAPGGADLLVSSVGSSSSSRSSTSPLGGGSSRSGAMTPQPERESEVSATIRALAPKPHMWSELYIEEATTRDLLSYQIKNAIAAAVGGGGATSKSSNGCGSAKGGRFDTLNRADMLSMWYLSLTREELRVLRFAKKLYVAVRCLGAVNAHLCVGSASLPQLPAVYRRTVDETQNSAGSSPAVVSSPFPAAAITTTPTSLAIGDSAASVVPQQEEEWLSLTELFPSKVTKIEELKALLAVGARLMALLEDGFGASVEEAVREATGDGSTAGALASAATRPSVAVGGDESDADETSSQWSLGFDDDEETEDIDQTPDVPVTIPSVNDTLTAFLSRHFALKLTVLHDAAVYVDAARALLRCDPREKN